MKKIIFFLICFFYIFSVFALEIRSSGTDDGSYKDWYKFNTGNNGNIIVNIIDSFVPLYEKGNRVDIIQQYNANTGTGILQTELYGDFYLKNDLLELMNDPTINSNCTNSSYSYTGTFISPFFGEFQIEKNNFNYYCPLSGKTSLNIDSELLGNIIIVGNNSININTTTNTLLGNKVVSNNTIFDNTKISITGLVNLDNPVIVDSSFTKEGSVNINVDSNNGIINLKETIDKNVSKYIQQLEPNKDTNTLGGFSKKFHYYNFEGQENTNSSNVNNKGKILTIGTGGSGDTFNKMIVSGNKVLYVNGGNIYINADIYNSTNLSKLVIIVKRDKFNRSNGGNIYINPNVTNIDAILVADGSIINFDGTNVLNIVDNTNILRKQLLIYGSILTKNTYGEDVAIYGTDDYISNGGSKKNNINTYNLSSLRSFQVILNDDVSGECSGNDINGNSQIVAKSNNNSNIALQYAFAGKRKCYLTDKVQDGLRGTEKISQLVIEYNPSIQTNTHFILENN